jgi:hypothetical protein
VRIKELNAFVRLASNRSMNRSDLSLRLEMHIMLKELTLLFARLEDRLQLSADAAHCCLSYINFNP